MSEPVVTIRMHAAPPGWSPEQFQREYMRLANNNPMIALALACADMSSATCGGLYRLPPRTNEADIATDHEKAVE